MPELEWQIARRQKIHSDSEQFFQLHLKAAKIEQCGARERIHQKVDITSLGVAAHDHRAENPRIG